MVLETLTTLSRKSQKPFWAYRGDPCQFTPMVISFDGMDDFASKK